MLEVKKMNCKDFREIADSYLSDELLVETNHEVLRHLENCPNCRNDLAMRREFREKLRSAVKNAPPSRINAAFLKRLQFNLRSQFSRPSLWERISANWQFIVPTFAVLLVALSIGLFVWRNNLSKNGDLTASEKTPTPTRIIENNTNTATSAIKIAFDELADKARGDHENCALKHNLSEKPVSLEKASQTFGKFNKDLDKTVFESVKKVFPEDVEFIKAHSCVFEGKRFAHIVLRYGKKIISVVVTESESGLSANSELEAITCSPAKNGLQVACFKTPKHAIFVVSDLSETENLMLARTIAPNIRQHIARTENKA